MLDQETLLLKSPGLNLSKAPQFGLRPRFIVTTDRIQEIDMAVERYQRCQVPVPQEWWDERAELLRWLVESRPGLVAARELHI